MAQSSTALRALVTVAGESRPVRIVGMIALLAVAALSLRISLTNAFLYANWADALSYADGARRILAGLSPYSAMQLAGPYPIDQAAYGQGFVYPPTGAYLLAPFMLGEPFWNVWNAMSFVAVVGIVILIVRRELGDVTPLLALATGAVALTMFQVGLSELKTGYLSPMVAAAFGAMWLWPRWSAIPALLFGLIKAFPAAGLLWTLRKGGHWKGPLAISMGALLIVTAANPQFIREWMVALVNAEPGCPDFALPSLGCLGMPAVGYAAAIALLIASWRAKRDDVSFLMLGLAITVPLPDIYWGNLMLPILAGIPLAIHVSRRWWQDGRVPLHADLGQASTFRNILRSRES